MLMDPDLALVFDRDSDPAIDVDTDPDRPFILTRIRIRLLMLMDPDSALDFDRVSDPGIDVDRDRDFI